MSSLSATQADGYYVPPAYFESGKYKTQSKNQYTGSKGHNQYLQRGVVRFELPYKGVCVKCRQSIARGTRFNAKKTENGKYFTTPIWEFVMNCRNCQHEWKVQTNPQERGFDYVSGIKIQAGQEDGNDGVVQLQLQLQLPQGSEVHAGLSSTIDAPPKTSLDRLESMARGAQRSKTEVERLQAIQKLNTVTSLNDADMNATIRKTFRGDRKLKRWKREEASKAGWRDGMEWLNVSIDDEVAAKASVYGNARNQETKRLQTVRTSSIFSKKSRKRRKCVSLQMDANDDLMQYRTKVKRDDTVDDQPKTRNKGIRPTIRKIILSTDGIKQPSKASINGMHGMLASYGSSSDNETDTERGHG